MRVYPLGMWLLTLLACPPDKTADTADTADTAPVDHTAAPGAADAWRFVDACGDVRVELTDERYSLALRAPLDLIAAAREGTSVSLALELPDPVVAIATEGAFEGMEVCSSAEEWPTVRDDGAWWTGVSGLVEITFVPDQAWGEAGEDWTYDGTEIGDLEIVLTDVTLEPAALGAGVFVVPDVTLSGRLARPDLPA